MGMPINEDNIIAGIAGLVGAYLMLKTVWFHTYVRDRAPRGENDPPSQPSEAHLKLVKEEEERLEALDRKEQEEKAKKRQALAQESPDEEDTAGETKTVGACSEDDTAKDEPAGPEK